MSGFCLNPRPRALVSYFGYGDIDGAWLTQPSEFYRKQPLVSKDGCYGGCGNGHHLRTSRRQSWKFLPDVPAAGDLAQ